MYEHVFILRITNEMLGDWGFFVCFFSKRFISFYLFLMGLDLFLRYIFRDGLTDGD